MAFAIIDEEYLNKVQLNIIGDGSHLINLREFVEKNIRILFFET